MEKQLARHAAKTATTTAAVQAVMGEWRVVTEPRAAAPVPAIAGPVRRRMGFGEATW